MIQIRKYSHFSPRRLFPVCPICNEVVELETSKTDGNGKAIHEDCYTMKTKKTIETKASNRHN
jgi:hypothetical protein